MVATALTVQEISILTAGGSDVPDTNGLDYIAGLTSTPAAGDYRFLNTGRECLYIEKNSGTTEFIVTINSVAACGQGYDHDTIIHITDPGSTRRLVGPFATNRFNDTVDSVANQVKFTTSGSNVGTKIGIIRLPGPQTGL